jgi:tetratricopeptide (TPR) repeat protein
VAPALRVDSDDEAAAARSEFEALDPGAPRRALLRAALVDFQVRQLQRALDGAHLEEAATALRSALTLWEPSELRGSAPPSVPGLLQAAEALERAVRRRGQHAEVVLALTAQELLAPPERSEAARARMKALEAWLLGEGLEDDELRAEGLDKLTEDYEAAARAWPSPFVVERLTALYLQRGAAAEAFAPQRGRRGRGLAGLLSPGRRQVLLDLARLYLRISQPELLPPLAAKLLVSSDEGSILTLISRATGPESTPEELLKLAQLFSREGAREADRELGLRLCRDGARRFPKAVEPLLCVGEFAAEGGQMGLALRAFEEARTLDPNRPEVWESLIRLSLARLAQIVTDEHIRLDQMEQQVRKLEEALGEAKRRFPERSRLSMSAVLFEVGRGYYNAGRPEDAVRWLERSVAEEPSLQALELLGQLRMKRQQVTEAVALFQRALAVQLPNEGVRTYLRAKVRRMLAEALDASGDLDSAQRARREAIADWERLLQLDLRKGPRAEALVERGKLLYLLGERDEALDSLRRGIDSAPDLAGSYPDVIAFLVPRGELDEALDAYHRALGRTEVTDYLKVYCSLWVVDLARRAGAPEDPLALAYLKSTDGGRWYAELARWATGRQTDAQLVERADTPGKRAEAAFYRALRAFGAGDRTAAEKLLGEVLSTDMMAFFEFDMAQLYLRTGGPPTGPTRRTPPPQAQRPAQPQSAPAVKPPRQRRPDGSI